MQYTDNYNFKKPEDNDASDNVDLNDNFDAIDAAIKEVEDKADEANEKIDDIDKEKLDGIADFIVEQGTSGIWTYRKWNSGVAECFTTTTQSGVWSPQNAFGTAFYRDATNWPKETSFPFTFTNKPSLKCTIQGAAGFYFPSERTTTTTAQLFMVCVGQQTNDTVLYDLYAIGKWK